MVLSNYMLSTISLSAKNLYSKHLKLSTLLALYVLPCCWRGIRILPRLEKLDKNQSLGDNFTDKTTSIGFNVSNRNTLKLLYSLSSFNFPDPCHNYEKSSSLRAMREGKK